MRWQISAGLVLAVILAGLVFLWVKTPALYGPSNEAKIATSNTRAGILTVGAAAIAATAAAAAVWVNHRTLGETQRANREEDQRERYATAIGQLGSDQRSVRLGAIYTLERIADYSEGDQRTVVEVLSAYIREKRPRSLPEERYASTANEHEEQDEAVLYEEQDEAVRVLPTDEKVNGVHQLISGVRRGWAASALVVQGDCGV